MVTIHSAGGDMVATAAVTTMHVAGVGVLRASGCQCYRCCVVWQRTSFVSPCECQCHGILNSTRFGPTHDQTIGLQQRQSRIALEAIVDHVGPCRSQPFELRSYGLPVCSALLAAVSATRGALLSLLVVAAAQCEHGGGGVGVDKP